MASPELEKIEDERSLEEALSQPYPQDIEAAADLRDGLLVLGAGGKMGPTLVRRALAAFQEAGLEGPVTAVSRFSDQRQREALERAGARVISVDLMDPAGLAALPKCPNVIFMAGYKFGSSSDPAATWAVNCYLPGRVAECFQGSRIVAFSTGNVYPLVLPESGGCSENDPVGPVGEYAQSCLGRERVLSFFSRLHGTPACILRLNYAVEARYGVLLDIGRRVFTGEPVPLEMGHVNLIWQGDANSVCLRAFGLCDVPAAVLNLTGPETMSVRWIAQSFGERFGREPIFKGSEGETALLSNAERCHSIFGRPQVSIEAVIDLVADWIREGRPCWEKPTKFEVTDGKF